MRHKQTHEKERERERWSPLHVLTLSSHSIWKSLHVTDRQTDRHERREPLSHTFARPPIGLNVFHSAQLTLHSLNLQVSGWLTEYIWMNGLMRGELGNFESEGNAMPLAVFLPLKLIYLYFSCGR